VVVVLEQAELPLQRERTPGRIDHPARVDRRLLAARASATHGRDVGIGGDVDIEDAAVADEVDAGGQALIGEEVLEAAAIELVARRVERAVDAAPDPLGQVAVVAGREPPPEAELADLVPLEVLLEAQHVAEVVGGDLDGRSPTLKAASGAGPGRFSAMTTLVCGRCCLSCSPRARPASPPPRIATS
jgi:hypothetical protein